MLGKLQQQGLIVRARLLGI
ncbi:hypothetical protein QUA20_01360 [Microcoleus sp. Pol7_A1]